MKFRKFFPLAKVDDQAHRIFGPVMSEAIDSDNEIADYTQHKTIAYPAWSEKALRKTTNAGQEPSLGNIRIQHDHLKLGGKATAVTPDDAAKTVMLESEPVNSEVWHMLQGGFLTGYSQAGVYLWRKCNDCGASLPRKAGANYCAKCGHDVVARYGSELHEVSYVDDPANPDAAFTYVRSDGQVEMRKFAHTTAGRLSDGDVDRIVKALRSDLEKGVKYLVPPDHLPYTDASGKPDHGLMGNAWAALHSGFRGNKYEGPGKTEAIARLKRVYESEGMDTPSEKTTKLISDLSIKTDHPEIWDAVFDGDDDELETRLEKFSRIVGDLLKDTATGANEMNPEQIKKCADALGITVEEFQAKYIDGDLLAKGAKGLAALGAHLKKASAHHAKMAAHHDKMHKAHAAMADLHKEHAAQHDEMADHLENCHKAHGACMDGADSEKVLKALVAELGEIKVEKKNDAAPVGNPPFDQITLTADDMKKAIDEALKTQAAAFEKKLESTVAPIGGREVKLTLIDRDGNEVKKDSAIAKGDPFGGN